MSSEYADQAARVKAARHDLSTALGELATAARRAARTHSTAARAVNLSQVFGIVGMVRRAEEAVDIAELDLATARGEDA